MNGSFDLARLATVSLCRRRRSRPMARSGHRRAGRFYPADDRLRHPGVFLPAAGTGEFHSLSADEVVACVKATLRRGRRRLHGAGADRHVRRACHPHRLSCGRGRSRRLTAHAADPFVSLRRRLSRLLPDDCGRRAAATVGLQAWPGPEDDALLAELGERGRLVGVKYAVNDVDAFTRFVDRTAGRISLSCGTASAARSVLHALRRGGRLHQRAAPSVRV